MRTNMPVTQQEHKVPHGVTLVSRTDASSYIVHVNDAFVDASGFTREELIGETHNIVRHPDMPPEAFRDLWATIRAGRPWSGLVKNRRKNGDYYWVRANVSPAPDGGYMSVRMCPSAEEVAAAEALYARMRNGERIRLHEGEVVSRNPLALFGRMLRRLSLSQSLWLGALLSTVLFLAAIAFALNGGLGAGMGRTVFVALAAFGSLFSICATWYNVQRIRRDVGIAAAGARAIANGKLTELLQPAGRDEIGTLVADISIMRNNLHELVAEMHRDIRSLGSEAKNLATSAASVSGAAAAQKEATSSMASAVTQLSDSITRVESHAGDSRRVTQQSVHRSDESAKVIQETADEMDRVASAVSRSANSIRELDALSGQISTVVSVIREIADQTNLLALNAAIEAARAGEQGRGFAVVADEVRKLAERTTNSTAEIATMIERIQRSTSESVSSMETGVARVADGVELARKAAESVSEIREGANQVTSSVDSIGRALQQQVTATQDIERKVAAVAADTVQVSASAEQAASAAASLEDLAAELRRLADRFQVA